jgi:hypothetical protein
MPEAAHHDEGRYGLSRRRFVTRTAAAAGAAWVVPSIVSATPAFAQGSAIPIPIPGSNTVEADPPPQNTSEGTLTSDTQTFYWFESGPTVLGAPITVSRNGAPGSFTGGTPTTTTIPSGTTLFSFFVHADKTAVTGSLTGSLTFTGGFTIVGMAWKLPQLTGTSSFEYPGTTYDYEQCESGDNFVISPGSTTITWTLNNAHTRDEFRIFVSPP